MFPDAIRLPHYAGLTLAVLLSACSGVSDDSSSSALPASSSAIVTTSSVQSSQAQATSSSSTVINSSIGAISSGATQSSSQGAASSVVADCRFEDVKVVFDNNNCMACHNATAFGNIGGGLNLGTGNVGQRLLDAPTQYGNCNNELLIDSINPDNSLLLKLINKERLTALNTSVCKRGPMPINADKNNAFMDEKDFSCVKSWLTDVAKHETPLPPEPSPNTAFKPATAGTALAKAKYILHGGAPTEDELTIMGSSDGSINPEAMRTLIREWEKTPEYEAKIKDFLSINLQQRPLGNVRYNEQLNNIIRDVSNIDYLSLRSNFDDMFVRTAWDIVSKNKDFRHVITTREWQVTTAVLAALVYLDKENQTANRSYLQNPAVKDLFRTLEYLRPEDYTDWRTVKLTQANTPAVWSNSSAFTQSLRDIPDGGELALRYPRVGFFSTPVFLNYWVTNDDNQFRLTLNQTLIVALGKTFSPSDVTPHISEDGIPISHADPDTVCYQCHRHMDPMRLVFDNVLVTRYRAKTPDNTLQPSFSFYGVTKNFNNTDEFVQILKDHPELPTGWVQKLCMWGNSMRCDEGDPEFKRLVNFFKNNNYSMRNLMRQFFSSPIFTANRKVDTHENEGFIVSMSRGNHFCHSVNTRIAQINAAAGTTGGTNLCNSGALGVVPIDEYSRGAVDLVQASQVSLFDSKSIDRECSRVAFGVFANGNNKIFDLQAPVNDNLGYMAEYLMGIPKNHHRYNEVFNGLRDVYDLANKPNNCADPLAQSGDITCGYGLNKRDGLRAAWFSACTSPELISIGM